VRSYGIVVSAVGARWVERMLEQPAMRAWEDAALTETFREDAHEAEIAAIGTVTEDRRA
jgi:glutathione S-transferase